MNHTKHTEYRGWDIAIRCMQRVAPIDEMPGRPTFTATAHATLQDGMSSSDWIDPRVQVICLGNRFFANEHQCYEALLAEAKELIDALRR
jgi:hypothetical protein